MAEVVITIGGKTFEVACQDGEERLLRAAAAMLDAEAETLRAQVGRVPEARMLLMAGLMLADKAIATREQYLKLESDLAQARAENERLRSQPKAAPEKIEVPVIPPVVNDALAEIAARTEALAGDVEDRVNAARERATAEQKSK